jgi:hypothetical protein
LTAKIKIAIAAALALALLAGGFLAGRRLLERREREARAALGWERLLGGLASSELAAVEQSRRALLSELQTPPRQVAVWRERAGGKKLPAPPRDCAACLAAARREVTVEDGARGWWRYHDPDALDDRPGEFELTSRFYREALAGAGGVAAGSERAERGRVLLPGRTAIAAGVTPSDYRLELCYQPVRLRVGRAVVAAEVSARLALARSDATLYGDAVAGLELSW